MRTVDRFIAVILALGLLTLGVLVPVEVIYARGLDGSGELILPYQQVAGYLREQQWESVQVMAISAGVALVGLVLLAFELKPRRPGLLTMVATSDEVVAGLSRRSVARVLSRAALSVPEITSASARVTGRRAVLRARTRLRRTDEVEQQVRQRVGDALTALDLVRPPRLRLRLTPGRERV